MRPVKFLLLFSFSLIIAAAIEAADLDFPYANIRLKAPPASDPFPGFGSYYSTLSFGMKSALWNPASLAGLKLSEAAGAALNTSGVHEYRRTFKLSETGGALEFDPGSLGTGGKYGMFYRYPADIPPDLSTREIEVVGTANYATEGTGVNFSTALKVNDWLAVGFAANSPHEIAGTLAGDIPFTTKANATFIGQKLGDMELGADGKLRYTYTNGITVTYESSAAVWGGFLSQEATLPLIAFAELRNNISLSSPFIGTVAGRHGNFSYGLNFLPVNASANIDNDIRAVVAADTQDIYLYTPNFDPKNQADIQDWTLDPGRYGTANGFTRKEVLLPAGEIVGTAKYRGFYAASAARFDLGGMYDLTDWLTVGLVMENITGASLNLKGTGRTAFLSYRELNTDEADSFDQLIQPGGKTSYDLISDRWTTTFEAGSHQLYLEPEKSYALPRRLRYGLALKKPFLIALDFESDQNSVTINTTENDQPRTYTFSNLNYLRLGIESQFLVLPLWLRSGLTLLAKPTVTGLNADAQKNFDQAFQFGYLPVRLDLGGNINAWGNIIGASFGFNAQTILNTLQVDITNSDLGKLLFYNLYYARDAWQVDYLCQFDPGSTAAAYGSKTVPAGTEKSFEFADVKFMQTLGVTYRF